MPSSPTPTASAFDHLETVAQASVPDYEVDSSELLAHPDSDAGLRRADMVLFETPNGGAVFSVGSVTSCDRLAVESAVSRVTENVLQWFSNERLDYGSDP